MLPHFVTSGIPNLGVTLPSLKKPSAQLVAFLTVVVLGLGLNVSPAAAVETTTTVNGVVYTMDGAGAAYVSGFTMVPLATTVSIESSVKIGGIDYSVTAIGRFGFSQDSSLVSVTIPSSVMSIGDYAFYGATQLGSMTFLGAAPTVGSNAFQNAAPVVHFYSRFASDLVAGGFTSPTWQGVSSVGSDEILGLTPTPVIAGSAVFGQTLTANPGTWDSGVALSYVWKRNGLAVTGATSASYVLTAPDLAATISVEVTGTQTGYVSVTKASAATSIVGSAGFTLNSTPKITGAAKVGKVLTAKPGTWDAGVKLTYKWYRSGAAIKGATKATYKLAKADANKKIIVSVAASKAGFTSATKASKATGKVKR